MPRASFASACSFRRRRARICLAVILLVAAAPPAARAANDLCGKTITSSVTFTEDQICGAAGITVETRDVTIDLAGFTLQGTGGIGIFVLNDGVTILNGTIRGFEYGVAGSGHATKVSNVVVRDNTVKGGELSGTMIVDRCAFIGNGIGLQLTLLAASETGTVTNSAVVDNASDGLNLLNAGGPVTIKGLVASGNGGNGITLRNSSDESVTTLSGSAATANVFRGIYMKGPRLTVQKNTVSGNAFGGIYAEEVRGARILANTVVGNAQKGIAVTSDSDGALLSKNRVVGSANDGIAIDATSDGVVLKANTVVGNGDDGLETLNATATLQKTTALANGAFGIFALSGAIDGGGNSARANASLTACSVSVACAPAFVPKPGPVTPTCGMVVTSSITLGADTPLCAGSSGLIVAADKVTINLNGHRVLGDRSAGHTGIDVQGHAKVTIKNGVVRGFDRGIVSAGSNGLKISNVEVRDNLNEGADLDGQGVAITKSTFILNGDGGVRLGAGTPAPKISASFFVANGGDGLRSHAERLVADKLTATLNEFQGIVLGGNERASLKGGTIAGNGDVGVLVESPTRGSVTKSLVVGNAGEGIALLSPGSGHVVAGNTVGGNASHGIAVANAASSVAIAKNVSFGNTGHGISLDPTAGTAALTTNRAVGNRGSGIVIDAPTATLTKNVALANGLHGITTQLGVVDGGGNQARDNVNDPQCGAPLVCP